MEKDRESIVSQVEKLHLLFGTHKKIEWTTIQIRNPLEVYKWLWSYQKVEDRTKGQW